MISVVLYKIVILKHVSSLLLAIDIELINEPVLEVLVLITFMQKSPVSVHADISSGSRSF